MPDSAQKSSHGASIVPTTQAPLSKEQTAFNSLIKKIEARRKKLAAWDSAIGLFKRKFASDLLPLRQQEIDLQIRLAQALDAAHAQKGLTKSEKRKMAWLIVDLAQEVLRHTEHDQLKALYNKHGQSDFDTEEAARLDGVRSMLEDVLGMDLGEGVDMRSEEDVLKRVEAEYWSQHEQWQAEAATRRQSAKDMARAARQEAEEKRIGQSLRDVYRKLARSLHPDRETDPVENQRKNELMQRANDAYDKGNLLQLLELQIEFIDSGHLAQTSPAQLKHYSKILKGQLSELEFKLQSVEDGFAAEFNLSPFARLEPKGLMPMLMADISACQADIRQLQDQLADAADLKRLKAWLTTYSRRRQAHEGFDLPF
ncbi:MAG: J domain-containing protein [Candidatus Methylophosphatis roskildensis]